MPAKTDHQIKEWFAKASQSDTEYQLAASAWNNAMDTFADGEANPEFWNVVESSRQFLIDCNAK